MREILNRSPFKKLAPVFAAFFTFSAAGEEAPEILTASSPKTVVINGVGQNESGIVPITTVCAPDGTTFVTGSFDGQATFGTNVLNSAGGYGFDDIYLVKYDPAGNVAWAKKAGGSNKDFGRALALDGVGGVYVAGTTQSSPSSFGTNVLYTAFPTMFVARYDADGNCQWAKKGGTWQGDTGTFNYATMTVNALARDVSGNVTVGGNFNGVPNFGGVVTNNSFPYKLDGGTVITNRGGEDIFLAQYGSQGNFLWATNHGGTNNDYASDLAVDSVGAIYVSGSFAKNTVIGTQTFTNRSDGILLAKFSNTGDSVWTSTLSDSSASATNNEGYGWSVVVDSADHVAFSFEAKTANPFRYGGIAFTNQVSHPAFLPVYMGLLAQFNSSGVLQWLKRTPFNGASQTAPANPSVLAVDAKNNIYYCSASALMTNNTAYGTTGLGILKFNPGGTGIWTNSSSGALLTSQPPSVGADGTGALHGVANIKGSASDLLTLGWIYYQPFQYFGDNQLLFTVAPSFSAVPPAFVLQPTNMFFQPPKGLTNSAQTRAWPAPKYYWYMGGNKLTNVFANGFILALSPTTFTNMTNYFVVASNAYGMATSIVVNAQAGLAFTAMPPTNFYVMNGTTMTLAAEANGTSAISYQWRFNESNNLADATSPTLVLPNMTTNQSGRYALVISNLSGVLTSAPPCTVTVLPYGSLDPYYTNLAGSSGVTKMVRSPDGSFYVNNISQGMVYHLNPNGLLVTNSGSWSSTNLGFPLQSLLLDSNGKLLAGGNNRLVRLNANGTPDTNFNSNIGSGPTNSTGINSQSLNSLVQLPNGQYLAAGKFNRFNGVTTTNIVRLNNDGSLDTTFPVHNCLSGYTVGAQILGASINAIALQSDGKILLGGGFDYFDGVFNRLIRLNADGTLDGTFTNIDSRLANTIISDILPLADGKILVGGTYGFSGIFRINSDGSLDSTWLGDAIKINITDINLLPNGKLLVACDGVSPKTNSVLRLSYDGVEDGTFRQPELYNKRTYAIAQEPNGNVMVAGDYGLRRLLLEPAEVVLPSFASGAGVTLSNGQIQLSACGGVEGQLIIVQASTDLIHWTNISTNTVTGGCITYTDPQATTLPNRFYRLTAPQP